MLVMADMQRRLIAAIRPEGDVLMDDDLADMEAAAAVFARLAAHKLQKTTHVGSGLECWRFLHNRRSEGRSQGVLDFFP